MLLYSHCLNILFVVKPLVIAIFQDNSMWLLVESNGFIECFTLNYSLEILLKFLLKIL